MLNSKSDEISLYLGGFDCIEYRMINRKRLLRRQFDWERLEKIQVHREKSNAFNNKHGNLHSEPGTTWNNQYQYRYLQPEIVRLGAICYIVRDENTTDVVYLDKPSGTGGLIKPSSSCGKYIKSISIYHVPGTYIERMYIFVTYRKKWNKTFKTYHFFISIYHFNPE